MKSLTRVLAAFFKRKTTWFALAVGILVGVFFWWRLPISPRLELPVAFDHYDLDFSKDGKTLAITSRSGENHSGKTFIQLWNLAERKKIVDIDIPVSFPVAVPLGPSVAFSPDGQTFLVYVLGKIRSWNLESGLETPTRKDNHFNQFFDGWSRLVTDSQGDIFVLFYKEFVYQVWDINAGEELSSFPRWGHLGLSKVFPGGSISKHGNRITVRDFPRGIVRGEIQLPKEARSRFWKNRGEPDLNPNFAMTPDCQTLVNIYGNIHIWEVATGEERMLERQANDHPTLTPDGKFLGAQIKNWVRMQTWFNKLEDFLGIGSKPKKGEKAVILYDLSSGDEVGFIADATLPQFSPDGKTLAVLQGRSLHLYDFPLRKPLGTILLFAFLGAAPILLLGQLAAFWKRRRARNHKSDHEAGGER
jgi:WD40 repeat protein